MRPVALPRSNWLMARLFEATVLNLIIEVVRERGFAVSVLVSLCISLPVRLGGVGVVGAGVS